MTIAKLADEVASYGITDVFGVPGGGQSLELISELLDRGLSFHATYFEGAAAIMAGAFGKLNGNVGVVITIKGPGLANALPGLAFCSLENFPVVVLTEAYSQSDSPLRVHKRLDHRALVAPVVKEVLNLRANIDSFSLAACISKRESPGPVVINLAEDGRDFDQDYKGKSGQSDNNNSPEECFQLLRDSKTPVVIAGTLGCRIGWSERLEELRIPMFTTVAAKGLVNETKDYSAGIFTGAGLSLTLEDSVIPKSDLVVGLGLRNRELLYPKEFDCPVINVDAGFSNEEEEIYFSATTNTEEDDELFNLLGNKLWGLTELQKYKKRLADYLFNGKFLPAEIFRLTQEYFGNNVRLISDTGLFCTIAEHTWVATSPQRFVCSGNSRYMGTGVPMALGACVADRKTVTIVSVGDGGIGAHVAELKLAVKEALPLLVLFMSDAGYGSIRARAIKDQLHEEPLIIERPSWFSVIQGFGMTAKEIRSLDELTNALNGWDSHEGPIFLECLFQAENYRSITDNIR